MSVVKTKHYEKTKQCGEKQNLVCSKKRDNILLVVKKKKKIVVKTKLYSEKTFSFV